MRIKSNFIIKIFNLFFILLITNQCSQLSSSPVSNKKTNESNDYLLNSSAYEKSRENSREIKKIKASYLKQNEYIDSLFYIVEVLTNQLNKQKNMTDELKAAFSNDLSVFRDDYLSTTDSIYFELTNNLVRVDNKVSILEDRASYTDSTNFEILNMLVMFENKITSLTDSYREISQLKTLGNLGSKDLTDTEFREKYIEGLSLYQNSDYKQSLEIFQDLIVIDKNHDLSDNCQYWIGEIYYGNKDFRRSIKEFEKVFNFKDSNKSDDSQYKLGLCYINIGNKSRAKDEFQRLIDLHPNSEYFQKARQWLLKL